MLPIQLPPGKKKSHLGQHRRGRLPSSITTSVSCICRCTKWTRRVIRIVARPGHYPPGHTMLRASHRKYIQYVLGTSGGWRWKGIKHLSSAHPVLNLPMSFQGTRHQVRVTLGAEDPQVESVPVREPFSSYTEAIGRRRVTPECATGLVRNT